MRCQLILLPESTEKYQKPPLDFHPFLERLFGISFSEYEMNIVDCYSSIIKWRLENCRLMIAYFLYLIKDGYDARPGLKSSR